MSVCASESLIKGNSVVHTSCPLKTKRCLAKIYLEGLSSQSDFANNNNLLLNQQYIKGSIQIVSKMILSRVTINSEHDKDSNTAMTSNGHSYVQLMPQHTHINFKFIKTQTLPMRAN